ncbi:MAG: hypothetical protein ACI9YL_001204 [Luteibaculaceae bacterium]|jgi:hypothetical protein
MKKVIQYILLFFVIGIGIYFMTKDTSSTLSVGLTEFAVDQPYQRVQKIFFADNNGNTILLEKRGDGKWDLNQKYLARPESVDLLLDVFKNIEVQGPIPTKGLALTTKLMAVSHVKVEIYTDDPLEPEKIWYIGQASGKGYGTEMLLETPEDGRSSLPYYTHILSFKGHLKARFFTNENDWRYTSVFEYSNLEFDRVEVEYPMENHNSFSVDLKSDGDLALFDERRVELSNFDTSKVRDFILGFKFMHYEIVSDSVSAGFRDSVFSSTPLAQFSVIEKGGTDTNSITLYPIKAYGKYAAENPEKPWDPNRIYGDYKGEFVFCQYYAFDRILYRKSEFIQ